MLKNVIENSIGIFTISSTNVQQKKAMCGELELIADLLDYKHEYIENKEK